jgi:DNA adenine methylase
VANPLSARPFLKWAGGKSQLVPDLLRYAPAEYGRYYEPFLGGGALFFALQPRQATLSDSNTHLIEVYRVVRREPEALIERLGRYRATREAYYRVRAQEPARLAPVERAARFVYLNRTCYNGLYRVNSRGQFNVPFGRYKNPRLCDAEGLRAASRALRRAKLRAGDFEASTAEAGRGDLVYFDPPFDPLSPTASFTSYTAGGFGPEEQARLAQTCRVLAQRGCHVMVSNSDTPLIRRLYRGFRIVELQARRAINRNGGGRGPVTELLVLNR